MSGGGFRGRSPFVPPARQRGPRSRAVSARLDGTSGVGGAVGGGICGSADFSSGFLAAVALRAVQVAIALPNFAPTDRLRIQGFPQEGISLLRHFRRGNALSRGGARPFPPQAARIRAGRAPAAERSHRARVNGIKAGTRLPGVSGGSVRRSHGQPRPASRPRPAAPRRSLPADSLTR